ncbi:hypothetical protein EK21DRAFT_109095 [Setomelanomma holmii]|uniref:C3H1-type domain-containing protein n=1 Tax=Setomelanomma holmii TaxID=210430 RepID=A0A9P4HFW2_9PLEO|nr:hypothetical protein EK21DRAFT_109095 [Setomelanomma holmii]
MTVCKFYQQGTCRFGDQCKFEHPGARTAASAFGGGSSNNRFGGFNGDRYRPNQPATQSDGTFGSSRDPKAPLFHLDKADMKNDLTTQRPIYPLSCYGPGRDAPRQLIEGPVEISPEELRVRYYTQRLAGGEAVAQQEESALNEKMQQQVQSILNDLDGAVRYVEEGANVHPNRIDIANGNAASNSSTAASTGAPSSNPFSQAPTNSSSQPAANPFMKAPTATFGQSSTPGFAQPAFSQPTNPSQTPSTFGQPSQSGQAASGFGAASSLGAKPSPFGQPSALGGGAAFGKPAFGASGFGQPSMSGAGSALGSKPAFGQASAPGTASPFGQTSAAGQQANPFSKPAFGQSGFGQASQPGASNASPFGQAAQTGALNASPFGQAAPSGASPFGQQLAAQASPFGQQAPPAQASPFGSNQSKPAFGSTAGSNLSKPAGEQPNPFQASSQSPFGQPSQPASNASPFGAQSQPSSTPANPFLQKPQGSQAAAAAAPSASPFGAQAPQAASPFAQATTQPQQQAASPAAPRGTKEIDPKDRFKEGKPEEYEDEQGKTLEEIYKRVGQLGRFNDDEEIPLVPPKCEWIVQVPLL